MAFLSCSDETSCEDFVVFPIKFNLINNIKVGDLIRISGKVEKRLDKYQVVVNNIENIN